MKKALFTVFIALLFLSASSQENTPAVNGTNLENVPYPFPVSYIRLRVQGEQLQMAYMDVKPEKPNGTAILLLHGKNFNGAYWQQTAQRLQQ